MACSCATRNIHMGFTEGEYPEGTHMCLIFNHDEEPRDLMMRFFAEGLKDRERASYFSDVWDIRDIRASLEKMGVDTAGMKEKGQLNLFTTAQAYYPDGKFTAEAMWGRLKSAYASSLTDGFSGVRVTGEMSWALKGIPGSDQLARYESGINQVVKETPVTAICQYDARRFDGVTLMNILRVHPYMIVRGQVMSNPHYEEGAFL